jgi:hypothetical protein
LWKREAQRRNRDEDQRMMTPFKDLQMVSMNFPKQMLCQGLDRKGISVTVTHDEKEIEDISYLRDPSNVSSLYYLLCPVMADYEWEAYFSMENLNFQWTFCDMRYTTSNPCVELLFRCMRMLISMFNEAVMTKATYDQEDLEKVVKALNVAIRGALYAKPYCDDFIVVPALLCLPHLRPCHEKVFAHDNIDILSHIGTHFIQTLVYMIITQSWINVIKDDVSFLFEKNTFGAKHRLNNIHETESALRIIQTDVLCNARNPLFRNDEYQRYLVFSVSSKHSILSMCKSVANFLEDRRNQTAQDLIANRLYLFSDAVQKSLVRKGITPPSVHFLQMIHTPIILFGCDSMPSIPSAWLGDHRNYALGRMKRRHGHGVRHRELDISCVSDDTMPLMTKMECKKDSDGCCMIL